MFTEFTRLGEKYIIDDSKWCLYWITPEGKKVDVASLVLNPDLTIERVNLVETDLTLADVDAIKVFVDNARWVLTPVAVVSSPVAKIAPRLTTK